MVGWAQFSTWASCVIPMGPRWSIWASSRSVSGATSSPACRRTARTSRDA
ncbi:hypothetical protein ACFQX7_09665 [Luedemannella flava]